MRRTRDRPLETFKKLPLVRSIEDIPKDDSGFGQKSTNVESDFLAMVNLLVCCDDLTS